MTKKILIIDDDPIFSKIYEGLFQSHGFIVDLARDGKSALDQLVGMRPDLVLLDLFLGKVNGVQVLKEIRSRPTIRTIPVIVLSTNKASRLVDAAWRAGANRCLWKDDFDPDQVLDVVNSTLSAIESASEPRTEAGPVETKRIFDAGRRVFSGARSETGADLPGQSDLGSRLWLRNSFARAALPVLAALRAELDLLVECQDSGTRDTRLRSLSDKASDLLRSSEHLGVTAVGRFCESWMRLIAELQDDPQAILPSPLNTLTQAVNFLGDLLKGAAQEHVTAVPQATILVVDDDQSSRWVIRAALEAAGLKAICLEDPHIALRILEENAADLVCLDVAMPAMGGFELCARIREIPKNRKTPVMFVTGYGGFENRARSSLSGGDDFIAKPFLLSELGLKAMVHVLGGPLRSSGGSE